MHFPQSTLLTIIAALACAADAGAQCNHVSTFADDATPTVEYFFSPSGDDQLGDGTRGNPFRSVAKALTLAGPGVALTFLPGQYAGGNFANAVIGTAEDPVWIRGASAIDRAVIVGGTNGIQLSRARFVVIENLEVRDAAGNGINCDDGGDVNDPNATGSLVFRNLYIHDIGVGNNDGLKLSGVRDLAVLDCQIARCGGNGSGSAIDMVGCHRGVLARNHLYDASASAIQAKGGTSDIDIRWNVFENAGQRSINIGGSTGFQFFRPPLSTTSPNVEARDIRIFANIFRGSTTPLAFVGAVDCVAVNNTIDTPGAWTLRILQETTSNATYAFLPCGNNTVAGNVIYFSRSSLSRDVNVGANTAPQTFILANNLWYAYDDPTQSAPNLPTPETDGLTGVDPQFVAPVFGDFRVTPTSPALAMGWDHLGSRFGSTAADMLGTAYSAPPTIGAFEGGGAEADLDCDQQLTASDLEHWSDCLAGPSVEPPTLSLTTLRGRTCLRADVELDRDVDLRDWALAQR